MAYDNDVIEKKSFLFFLNSKKYYALILGLGVACIHFVVTWVMILSSEVGFLNPLFLISLTPSWILYLLLASLKIDLLSSSAEIPLSFLLFSSFFYGILAGFLASKKKILRWIGIVIIGLLILSYCELGAMFGFAMYE